MSKYLLEDGKFTPYFTIHNKQYFALTKILKILLPLLSLAFFSCSSNTPITKELKSLDKKVDIHSIAKEKYGNKYSLLYNTPKDYILCTSVEKTKIPGDEFLRYFIFDVTKNIIVSEDKIRNGKVFWNSDYEIKIIEMSSILREESGKVNGFIINVKKDFETK